MSVFWIVAPISQGTVGLLIIFLLSGGCDPRGYQNSSNRMAVSIRRKENETSSGFLFRATKRIQKSGVLFETRKKRFYAKEVSKAKRKVKAIHRLTIEGYMKKFMKLGYSQNESINMARRILKGITREN